MLAIPDRHQQLIDQSHAGLVADFRRWALGDTICAADTLYESRWLYIRPSSWENPP